MGKSADATIVDHAGGDSSGTSAIVTNGLVLSIANALQPEPVQVHQLWYQDGDVQLARGRTVDPP